VNRTTGQIFVANYAANSVTVINGHTNSVISVIPVANGPNTVAVNEATNHVFVGNWIDGSVTVIDANSLRVIAQVPLPLRPGPNCPLNCGQLRLTADPVNDKVYASWTGESGSEPGLMTLSDPVSPFGPLSVTSVTQGANGVVVLNPDGSVAYTPNVGFAGTDTFNYSAADGLGGVSNGTVTITVHSTPIITTAVLPNVVVGQSYNQTLSASGGTSPYMWSVVSGQLPAGLSLNGATGTIAGTASSRGTFTVTLQVRDIFNNAALGIDDGCRPARDFDRVPGQHSINTPWPGLLFAGGTTGATWTLNTNNSPLLTWLSLSPSGVLHSTPPYTALRRRLP
jgi:YVTN family beta-propeller protein